jgi:hypothetical protein
VLAHHYVLRVAERTGAASRVSRANYVIDGRRIKMT